MTTVLLLAFGSLVSALIWWGSIKIVDRGNERNSFVAALVVAIAYSFVVSTLGILIAIFPLVGFLLLLFHYYRLDIGQCIMAFALMVGMSYGFHRAMGYVLEHGEGLLGALWGWPLAIALVAGAIFPAYRLSRALLVKGAERRARKKASLPRAKAVRAPEPVSRPARRAATVRGELPERPVYLR